MGRRPLRSEEELIRGAWSASEDRILSNYITAHGEGKWSDLPQRAGLKRSGQSCRLRWLNYLRPGIKRGNITPDEEDLIIRLRRLLGNRWSLIAGRLPGRTDNEIKNHWNTYLRKRVQEHLTKSQEKKPTKGSCVEVQGTLESHQVVRTKAGRCTKYFFELQLGVETKTGALVGAQGSAPPSAFHDQYSSDDNMNIDMEEILNILDLNFLKVGDEETQVKGSIIDGNNVNNNAFDFSNHPFPFGDKETLGLNFLKVGDEEIQGKGSIINGNNVNSNVFNFSNHPFPFGDEETPESQCMTDYLLAYGSMELDVSTLAD